MLQILIISSIIISVSFVLLGFNIFFLKKKFPETSVGHNKNMKAMGIKCAKCEEYNNYKRQHKKAIVNYKELKVAVD